MRFIQADPSGATVANLMRYWGRAEKAREEQKNIIKKINIVI